MTPKQKNALTYLLGDANAMERIARRIYLEALRKAYRSYGISEKRKTYRKYQAIAAGLFEKRQSK